jgi:hypothetical protein
MKRDEASELLSIDGREVRITHPDKPYFTRDTKLTKLDLVRYYLSVASEPSPEFATDPSCSNVSFTARTASRSTRNERRTTVPTGSGR